MISDVWDQFIETFMNFPREFPLLETLMSAFVAFVLGIFWYHPKVMGEKWSEAHNVQKDIRLTPPAYIMGGLLWFITATIYSFLTQFLNPPEIGSMLGLSTFIWVGFILPPHIIGGFYSGNKLMVSAVDSSYYLAGLYLFAVIHDVL